MSLSGRRPSTRATSSALARGSATVVLVETQVILRKPNVFIMAISRDREPPEARPTPPTASSLTTETRGRHRAGLARGNENPILGNGAIAANSVAI